MHQTKPVWAWRFRLLKAEILIWQGKYHDALALLDPELPPDLASSDMVIRRRNLQGIATCYLRQFDLSEARLTEAEQLAGNKHAELLGDIALSRGILALIRGEYPASEVHLHRAIQFAHIHNQKFLEANSLGTLGVVQMRREFFDAAIDSLTASLAISRQLNNKTQIAKTLGNLGWCYYKMGDLDRALSLMTDAETASEQLGIAKDQLLWLNNLGLLRYDQRDYAAAEQSYLRALSIARALDHKSSAAICLTNLAVLALETRQPDLADKYNREALEIKRAIHDRQSELYSIHNEARILAQQRDYAGSERLLRSVIRESGENVSLRWESEAALANVYASGGNTRRAITQFQKALATIDKARAALSKDDYKLSFLTSAARFYDDYIDLLVAHGQAKEALLVAEHSRARTLAEGLGATFPLNNPADAQKVAARLHAVILSYWLKPGNSYVWAVNDRTVQVFALPSIDKIDEEVQAYRKALMGPRDVLESGNVSGRNLFAMLVRPAAKLIRPGARVIVIGDGNLHSLNFETLLVDAPRAHYLIEDAVFANAPSIGLLANVRQDRANTDSGLLLIGNPLPANNEYLSLANANTEMQGVSSHFSAQKTVLEKADATPRAYTDRDLSRFSYVHFVTHGTASRTSPLESSIILSPQGGSYKLYARDIMNRPLTAKLVTISACYGAGTRAYSGEGLVGLSWAFLRAGAHNVIASLWEVNDASTPQLMDSLYSELSYGRDPATALHSAKLAMLHSGNVYRRPFYWGAFQLYVGS